MQKRSNFQHVLAAPMLNSYIFLFDNLIHSKRAKPTKEDHLATAIEMAGNHFPLNDANSIKLSNSLPLPTLFIFFENCVNLSFKKRRKLLGQSLYILHHPIDAIEINCLLRMHENPILKDFWSATLCYEVKKQISSFVVNLFSKKNFRSN